MYLLLTNSNNEKSTRMLHLTLIIEEALPEPGVPVQKEQEEEGRAQGQHWHYDYALEVGRLKSYYLHYLSRFFILIEVLESE